MPAKFVFVTELKSDKTKNGKDYQYCLDQDKQRWNFFSGEKVELTKGYVFDYEISGEYMNVKAIKPVVNVFHQKALAETANRNDYIRNYGVSISYAKDLAVAGKIEPTIESMTDMAQLIYDWIQSRADAEIERLNPDKEELK